MKEVNFHDLKIKTHINELSTVNQMKIFPYFTGKNHKKSFYIEKDDVKYINWSEGHLFKGNIWCSREKHLRNVANIIKNDGYPVIRDGTKTFYQNSFKRLFSFKKE